jgi:hypothetical protein
MYQTYWSHPRVRWVTNRIAYPHRRRSISVASLPSTHCLQITAQSISEYVTYLQTLVLHLASLVTSSLRQILKCKHYSLFDQQVRLMMHLNSSRLLSSTEQVPAFNRNDQPSELPFSKHTTVGYQVWTSVTVIHSSASFALPFILKRNLSKWLEVVVCSMVSLQNIFQ